MASLFNTWNIELIVRHFLSIGSSFRVKGMKMQLMGSMSRVGSHTSGPIGAMML